MRCWRPPSRACPAQGSCNAGTGLQSVRLPVRLAEVLTPPEQVRKRIDKAEAASLALTHREQIGEPEHFRVGEILGTSVFSRSRRILIGDHNCLAILKIV